jgi:hypothetical protein
MQALFGAMQPSTILFGCSSHSGAHAAVTVPALDDEEDEPDMTTVLVEAVVREIRHLETSLVMQDRCARQRLVRPAKSLRRLCALSMTPEA